jgi:hypothetical protein
MKKHYNASVKEPRAGNALFTIFPYKKNSTWMFDDETRGLVMEPFVAGADTLLDKVCNGKSEITAIFSPTEFKGYDFYIDKVEGDENGTDYFCEKYQHELWLCPALWAYINPSPSRLYVQIKA